MSELNLSEEVLVELRERHVRFLAERLTDDRAKSDLVVSLGRAYDDILAERVRDVVDPKLVVDHLSAVATSKMIRGFAAPIGRDVHARVIHSLRSHDEKLGAYVPADARTAIETVVTRPDLLPEPLIRRVFEQEATEEMLRDVLYDALVQFNDGVNPFFADWGLPALVKKVMPIGGGAILKSLNLVRAEFDKRLEPEIRKFLLAFSRSAKSKLADFVIAKSSDPAFVAMRKNIVLFFYEQTLADIVAHVDRPAMDEVERAAEGIACEVVAKDKPRAQLEAALVAFVQENGDKTVGEWLSAVGVTERPDFEAVAELLWPHVQMLLRTKAALAFLEQVTRDFYATLGAR